MAEILENVGTVAIPATIENFVAKDKFIVNTDKNALAEISFVGNNFSKWFLGKIEKPKTETILRYAKLVKPSVDGSILAELGGKEKAETTLTEIYALMEKQRNRESDVLRIHGSANIFYVRDINNSLRAVRVCWLGGVGWDVSAYLLNHPNAWFDGDRVFSCNS